ncbi:MAG: SDR family oxidoreductase [Defluviitaleaceae bacterium]|nr:SDR family oxidoreductase [Defluviitaleaceae bacterium]
MDLGLKGKSALVLASSSGLGKGIALEMAREQAKVMLFSSSESKLKEAQADIEKATGNRPEYFVGDITNAEDIKNLVKTAVEKNGPIYALVNNTGGPKPGVFTSLNDEDWQKGFELCLLSYVRAIRECLPYMIENKGGRILCSTSSSVKVMFDNLLLSNSFRMGVVGLAKTLSSEHGKDNILVNVIGPARVETARLNQVNDLTAEKMGISVDEVKAGQLGSIPLGRYGNIEEFGRFATFLCSEANTYLTGQTILFDGGMIKAY